MQRWKTVAGALALAAAASLLAGCGSSGGGDESAPPEKTTDVPASAMASVSGLVAYLGQLIANTNETGEPVFVGNAVLPVDDTASPSPLP